jgi:hypothetical protein
VELQRIVCAQADIEPRLEEIRERVPLVREEESVVAQRAHGDSDLLEIEQVLQRGDLAEQDSMRDGVRGQEGGREVVGIACFARVGTQDECICGGDQLCRC